MKDIVPLSVRGKKADARVFERPQNFKVAGFGSANGFMDCIVLHHEMHDFMLISQAQSFLPVMSTIQPTFDDIHIIAAYGGMDLSHAQLRRGGI
ncbi:unnamed protein product [Fusarium graminearum]|nr:unnamed protein product [Fusarium graminearum]